MWYQTAFICTHVPLSLGSRFPHANSLLHGPLLHFLLPRHSTLSDVTGSWSPSSRGLLPVSGLRHPRGKTPPGCSRHLGDFLISFHFYLISKELQFLYNHCSNSCSFTHKVVYSIVGQLRPLFSLLFLWASAIRRPYNNGLHQVFCFVLFSF